MEAIDAVCILHWNSISSDEYTSHQEGQVDHPWVSSHNWLDEELLHIPDNFLPCIPLRDPDLFYKEEDKDWIF
jgi:hypothetical protein